MVCSLLGSSFMLWIVVHDPLGLVIHSLRNITPYCFVSLRASTPPGRISQNLRHQETQPRIKLHTEGLVIPSIQESFQETSESERQTVVSARIGDRSSKHRNPQLVPPETRSNETYQGGGGAKHEEDSRRKLFTPLICSCSTTRNCLFSTVYANRTS